MTELPPPEGPTAPSSSSRNVGCQTLPSLDALVAELSLPERQKNEQVARRERALLTNCLRAWGARGIQRGVAERLLERCALRRARTATLRALAAWRRFTAMQRRRSGIARSRLDGVLRRSMARWRRTVVRQTMQDVYHGIGQRIIRWYLS